MLVKLSDIFSIEYPKTMIYSEQTQDSLGYFFVSSSGSNNGIVGRISKTDRYKLYKKGGITVPLKGSVLEAFYQLEDFYVAHQIAVLYSKREMTEEEKFFYCLCIKKNKYRFSYGRQADRTLKDIMLPAQIPENLSKVSIPKISKKPFSSQKLSLLDREWKWFEYEEVFDIQKGKRLTKGNMKEGKTPFIGSTEIENGVTANIDKEPIHKANTISVTYNGSVAEAFYQPKNFWASDDVNVLYPKNFELNPYRALFLTTLIRKEKYRFNYGRKWHLERMKKSKIKLPITSSGTLDWQFMEDFIKGLPYSKSI